MDRLENVKTVNFEKTRVMIIGPEFTDNQINEANDHVEIWKVTLYDDGRVAYENLKNDKKENKSIQYKKYFPKVYDIKKDDMDMEKLSEKKELKNSTKLI